jgi:hypothetical protein
MKLKALLPVLVLAAFSVSCEQETPTAPDDTAAVPADGPQFAKPVCPGPHPSCKDGDEEPKYSLVYDRVDEGTGNYILSLLPGSDCRRVSRFDGEELVNAADATFWCNTDDPTFIQQVIDPEGDPVTGGTVTFSACTRKGTTERVPAVYCFHVGFSCNYGWQEYET